VAEQPGRVLRLSERVADAGSTTFLRRHLLDVAAAHVMLRQRREAMTVLDRLYTETPAWLRHQRMATQVFHDAQQLGGRATGQERRLAVFFDAP
jgi:hypothetical protein